jgi:pseudaminic acid synthase
VNKSLWKSDKPFVIAEMSGNHNGSIDRAISIIERAAEAGASAVKFQTYTPDTMTLDGHQEHFRISNPESLWQSRSLYDLYSEASTPWEWHEALFEKARTLGIVPFSTPFDASAVAFLENLDVELYKIASFENTDLPLIAEVSRTGKPVIISIGLASLAEIEEAVQTARDNGCADLALLKTTSAYPAKPDEANLATIPKMIELFDCTVGISDHTLGNGVSVAAVGLGAKIIEKHLTLSREDGGVDSQFSCNPDELARLVEEAGQAYLAKGEVFFGPTKREEASLMFRRSIFASEPITKGELFTAENTRILRPNVGMQPKQINEVLGRVALRNFVPGDSVQETDIAALD